MEPITLACHHLPAVTVIKVGGELDLMTADTLQERSREVCRPGDQVVFDLTETTFMDCSGVRALLRARQHVHQEGGSVRLSGLQSGPAKIIAITHADQCLPVHDSLEQAVGIALAYANGHRDGGEIAVGTETRRE
jgi:anti-sigma B factor antagonist